MASTFHIDIVSAEKKIYSGRAEKAIVTGTMGELGIIPGHSQLLTTLKPGEIHLKLPDGSEEIFYVSGGILEIQPHWVTVLADSADRARDLDEMEAQDALKRAEQLMQGKHAEVDYAQALAEVARAAAQIRAIRKLKQLTK